jgi:predicted DNA-binding WGR domain protein
MFLIHSPTGKRGGWVVLNEISVELEARDASINCQRFWEIAAGPDLFGEWTAEVRFGRIGAAGRMMRHRFDSEEDARSFVRARLLRRRSLVDRLGVSYRVLTASPAVAALVALVGLAPHMSRGHAPRETQVKSTGYACSPTSPAV